MEFILPAVLGAIAAMAIGMFWYSPKGFGKSWMLLTGMTPEKMKNPTNGVSMPVGTLLGFASSMIKVAILAGIISVLAPAALSGALFIGGMVWFGFFMTNDIGAVLWEMKSWKLFFINTSYNLVMLLVSSAIIFYI